MSQALWRGIAGVLLFVASSTAHAATVAAGAGIEVTRYSVRLDPDLAKKTVRGSESIEFSTAATPLDGLDFDAGEIAVDSVSEQGNALQFEKSGARLHITLAHPAIAGERRTLNIDYRAAPRFGLEFHPERNELYTAFSTSQWLVCIDAPSVRASLDLSLAVPADLKVFATGTHHSTTDLADGRRLHRWTLESPMPSYVYGFAAGRYTEAASKEGDHALHYASTDLTLEQLQRVFADTGDMLHFFSERAGVAYRGDYSQVLVTDTIGQELAGLSLMDEEFGRRMLDDPHAESLIAHELAHQWWGNRVTCRDWTHFWLNEGMATFMAAAYLQHRFGDAAYDEQVDRWRRRLQRLRAAKTDRPLIFPEWNKPTSDDRAVVYQKGAYVLHVLREELGELAFWRGLRIYTKEFDGRAVTTADFRRAMEKGSGRNLSTFFAYWVEGPKP